MKMHELQEATSQNQHLQHLQHLMEYVIQGRPEAKTNYQKTSEHTGHSEMTWELLMG